jgi:hypothetical protein
MNGSNRHLAVPCVPTRLARARLPLFCSCRRRTPLILSAKTLPGAPEAERRRTLSCPLCSRWGTDPTRDLRAMTSAGPPRPGFQGEIPSPRPSPRRAALPWRWCVAVFAQGGEGKIYWAEARCELACSRSLCVIACAKNKTQGMGSFWRSADCEATTAGVYHQKGAR